MADTPNKEDGLDPLLVEATEFVMTDPVLKVYSSRQPSHFMRLIEKMLDFYKSRENPLKEDLKVVGEENELNCDDGFEHTIGRNAVDSGHGARPSGPQICLKCKRTLREIVESRDQRVDLEARIEGAKAVCEMFKSSPDPILSYEKYMRRLENEQAS